MLKKMLLFSLSVLLLLSSIMAMPVLGQIEGVVDYDSVEVMKIQSNTSLTDLKAKAAILIDCSTGTVLLEKNSHEKLPIASITKIMSMLLIMEAIDAGIISYDTKVTVSEYSWSFGGCCHTFGKRCDRGAGGSHCRQRGGLCGDDEPEGQGTWYERHQFP